MLLQITLVGGVMVWGKIRHLSGNYGRNIVYSSFVALGDLQEFTALQPGEIQRFNLV